MVKRYEEGFSVDMIAPNNRYVNDAQLARAVANMLARININVNLAPCRWPSTG